MFLKNLFWELTDLEEMAQSQFEEPVVFVSVSWLSSPPPPPELRLYLYIPVRG
jgi:hypothetical protein